MAHASRENGLLTAYTGYSLARRISIGTALSVMLFGGVALALRAVGPSEAQPAPPGFNPNCTFSGNNNNNNCSQFNFGPQPRSLNQPMFDGLKKQILSELPKDKPIVVMAVSGDSEAMNFAQQIHEFMKQNGFKLQENGISQGFFSGPVKGLSVKDDGPTRTFIVGANLP
jgi:hypothetical protein